jgi:hypothetical protein
MSDRLRGRGFVLQVLSNLDDGCWMSARRGPGAWFGRSNRVVASDGLPSKYRARVAFRQTPDGPGWVAIRVMPDFC